jgi:hypothetical protein
MASCILASCAGSGGGIGGTGYVSSGTITDFGSIVVNGVEFDTTNADVIIGGRSKGTGNQVVLHNLDIGQTVIVEGTENDDGQSGTAYRVRFTPNIRGPVAEIDHNLRRVVVLGQTIIIDARTEFKKPTTIGDLALNDMVEVSGLMGVAGAIRATHVKKMPDSFNPLAEVEVKGIVRDLDPTAETFKLNGLVVYYGLGEIGSLPDRIPKLGQLVHVRGKVGTGVTLIAAEIELADETRIGSAYRAVLEGFINDFISTSDFTVGNVRIQASVGTIFLGGQREQIAVEARIRVKGQLVDGILQAQQIFFRP